MSEVPNWLDNEINLVFSRMQESMKYTNKYSYKREKDLIDYLSYLLVYENELNGVSSRNYNLSK